MKLYHWNSVALEAWALGDIFVIAQDIEQARKKVIEYAQKNGRDGFFIDKIQLDINEVPDEDSDVYFVSGSA